MMSKFKKYVKGGSINKFWVREQMGEFDEDNNCSDTSISIKINNSININNYDEKFEFIKKHSDSPEDLKLAKFILDLE